MKILTIIQCSNLGGMEKVTLESLTTLKNAGHEVELFSLQPVGPLKPLAEERGIPLDGTQHYRFGGFGNIGELRKLIRQHKPDRVWVVGHNMGALLAARSVGHAACMSIHYHHCERPMLFWRLFYGLAKRLAQRIHFVSHFIFSEVEKSCFKRHRNVVCFPNVLVVPDERAELARDAVRIPEDAFVIGNAGWLIHRKAFDVFLETASRVKKKLPKAFFVIAGDGEEREALEKQAAELDLRDSVAFLGWQSDLEPFYGLLDLLLFNSRFDCLPTTPLEALIRGVPVVCSLSHGGLREVVRDGEDGYLMDHHDPDVLAQQVCRLYEDASLRRKLVESGRQRVLEICSPERHLEHLTHYLDL